MRERPGFIVEFHCRAGSHAVAFRWMDAELRQYACGSRSRFPSFLTVFLLLFLQGALGAQPPGDPAAYLKELLERLPPSQPWPQGLERSGELPPLRPLPPREADLPDPSTFADGRQVHSQQDWQQRRAEIRRLFEHNITGTWPPPPKRVAAREVSRRREGRVELVALRLELDGRREPSIGLHPYIPKGRGPFPVFLGPAWTENWARLAVRRGYLCAIYDGSDKWDRLHRNPRPRRAQLHPQRYLLPGDRPSDRAPL